LRRVEGGVRRRGGQSGDVLCRRNSSHRNWKGDDKVKGKTGGVNVEVEFVLDTDDVARTSEICWRHRGHPHGHPLPHVLTPRSYAASSVQAIIV